jgi:tetratricopeptide (TPR) repeat protein
MSSGDGIELFRKIAIEKSVKDLVKLDNEIIKSYIQRMSGYPLVIKWVVGQAALNKDIDRLVQSINSTGSEISKFCFEYIYDEMLSENAKLILRCLASSEQDLSQAALMYVTNFDTQTFEDTMRELELASLVIPGQENEATQQRIITRYRILPLTKGYLNSKEDTDREIKGKLFSVQNLDEESRRAVKHFQFSLEYLGAETDEELIAAKYVQTALTRNQAGDYDGAIEALERGRQIAPNFAGLYRNWAVIESDNRNYDKAADLFSKAASLNERDPTTWYRWGELEKKLINYPAARKYLKKALDLVDDKSLVLISLGNVEKQDSNFKEAIELFEEAIRISHENSNALTDRNVIIAYTSMAETYRRWGEIYEKHKQLEVAIEKTKIGYEVMSNVMKLGSSDIKAMEVKTECGLDLSRLYRKAQNASDAKAILSQILVAPSSLWSAKQKRNLANAYYHMTILLLDEGLVTDAKNSYESGLECLSATDHIGREKYAKLDLLLKSQVRFEGVFVAVNANKPYGFIKCPEVSENNIFAHLGDFIDEISREDFAYLVDVWVSFSVGHNDKGIVAKLIRISH